MPTIQPHGQRPTRPINGHTHLTPLHPTELPPEIEEEIMQSQRETLWHAKTEDQPPVEFSIVDDAPDGLSFVIEEGEHEIGVTLAIGDVDDVIDALATWKLRQQTKLQVTERIPEDD